jgi:hypothetical protein
MYGLNEGNSVGAIAQGGYYFVDYLNPQGKRTSKSIAGYRLLKKFMGEISECTKVFLCPQSLIP